MQIHASLKVQFGHANHQIMMTHFFVPSHEELGLGNQSTLAFPAKGEIRFPLT